MTTIQNKVEQRQLLLSGIYFKCSFTSDLEGLANQSLRTESRSTDIIITCDESISLLFLFPSKFMNSIFGALYFLSITVIGIFLNDSSRMVLS